MKESAIRVLIVDDGCLRRSLSERLRQEGFQLQETADPAQALDLIRHRWPHVIVSCTHMPQANGIEMLRRILKLDAGLPVVMATPSPNFREAVEAVKSGAYDYLETPSNNDEVVAAIHAQSQRSGRRFFSMDCGVISDSLIENELFGHERGAFTGADRAGMVLRGT